MKDEIKEILDEMYHIICTYSDDYDYFEENEIRYQLPYKQMEKLYDYITNLQEELKETADLCSKHFVKIQALKEEIKSLKGSCKFLGEKCNNQRKELNILNGGEKE